MGLDSGLHGTNHFMLIRADPISDKAAEDQRIPDNLSYLGDGEHDIGTMSDCVRLSWVI